LVPGLRGGQELPHVHRVGENRQSAIRRATVTKRDGHTDKAAMSQRGNLRHDSNDVLRNERR